MAKYIKCDCCGKRIGFGAEVYQYGGYCGVYCSSECFTDSYAYIHILDDDLAENCSCTVYDDEQQKRELEEEIRKHERELENLRMQLDHLTTQN